MKLSTVYNVALGLGLGASLMACTPEVKTVPPVEVSSTVVTRPTTELQSEVSIRYNEAIKAGESNDQAIQSTVEGLAKDYATTTTEYIAEDDPRWDAETMGDYNAGPAWNCATMGNKVCEPVVRQEVVNGRVIRYYK